MKGKKVTDQQIAEAYSRLGVMTDVATELGITAKTVNWSLGKQGIKTAGGIDLWRKKASRFDGQEAEIRDAYESGMTVQQLRGKFGPGSSTVFLSAVRRAGGTIRQNSLPTLSPDELDQIREMYEAGYSQEKICVEIGRSQAFVSRHMRRNCITPRGNVGASSGSWTGGRITRADGYIEIWVSPDDPLASMRRVDGYIIEHRLVMARSLGRPLLANETVHHINGDRGDNRIENLQLRHGKHGKGEVMCCLDCGSNNIGHAPIATSSLVAFRAIEDFLED